MRSVRIPGGIRLIDVAATAIVIAAVELNVATATGPGQKPLNALAYLGGAILPLPILIRRRWPLRELAGCALLLLVYYLFDRRNISPAPLLCLPLYDATVAGYMFWAIVIPAMYMIVGFFIVDASTHQGVTSLLAEFLQSVAVLFLAVALGEVVRSRRALAGETADRLRLAAEEREAEAARQVAEERLRIARDLHDTVAHSMATITVQAGSALHVLDGAQPGGGVRAAPDGLRDSLAAIRQTSKNALTDIRITLGRLRREDGGMTGDGDAEGGLGRRVGGLDGLPELADAVTAAGAPVRVTVEGERVALPAATDHAAYRILQESLTNVLRHAGPEVSATVRLSFTPGALTIRVRDDGGRSPASASGTNDDDGMDVVSGVDDADEAKEGKREIGSREVSGSRKVIGSRKVVGSREAGDKREVNSSGADGGAGGKGNGPAGSGHGITGMTERAAALGGELTAGPRPGGGFEIMARLPIEPGDAVRPPSQTETMS